MKKVALITGGSRRIGQAIATALAKHGWSIAIHHRNSAQEAHTTVQSCLSHQAEAASFQANLDCESACQTLFEQALHTFGQIDALINCAALFDLDDAQNVGFSKLQEHFLVNTAAPVFLARLLYRHYKERLMAPKIPAASQGSTACVIQFLDQKLWNPNPDFLSYTLSKAALREAITLQAQAYAPLVRVVGIAPGLTLPSHMMSEAKFNELHQQAPLGRSSHLEDITRTVLFLLESPAITGETILVDGGQHLTRMARDFSLM